MKNTWIVAAREFSHRVRTRGFLLASIGVPIIIILVWAGSGLFNLGAEGSPGEDSLASPAASSTIPEGRIGYVDPAGLIGSIPPELPGDLFKAFPDAAAASQALESGEIEAYYLIPPDFAVNGEVQRVSAELPSNLPPEAPYLNSLLLSGLFPEASQEELSRLRNPLGFPRHEFVAVGAAEPESTPGPEPGEEPGMVGVSMVPMLVTIIIIIPLFTSGGYLIQSVTQEKSNRVMEILLVSLRPWQLLTGKLLGLGALTLVQYVIWIAMAGLALSLTSQDPAAMLAGINLQLQDLVYILLFAMGGYAIYSAFMAGIGALAPSMEGGRSWVMLIAIPMMFPMYLWVGVVSAPHGLLAVSLSLIPFTAPVAMLMRMTSTTVPGWQIALSLVLLALTAVGTIWFMSRLFKVQTLLSGEAISFRRIWSLLVAR
jgi:ABC-2 type transport system permease protein